ncbi:MAG TPA: aldehyde dehydrogenase family protein [Candidatus Rubrimentiphilum sp.]|nr:aldehyde dehydrogenase family protein [Candidatus Rubrimentiphilum sp.]
MTQLVQLLEETRRRTHRAAPEWVALSSRAKGLAPGSYLDGEEWISGPWAVLYAINRYIRTLERTAAGRTPIDAQRVITNDDITRVRVFPHDLYDRILLQGVTAEVILNDGSVSFIRPPNESRNVLVLGAGNISSIPALDVLYKIVAENASCVLKLSPVNSYLRPVFEQALAPLIEAGKLRFVSGDAQLGAQLCTDNMIDEIHVTGSAATFAAIRAIAPHKRITAELGSVTPTIAVPGDWSKSDLRFQAENIATQKTHNAGFNCIAAQVLILPRDWPLKEPLLQEVERVFNGLEQRPEYYPGAAERRAALTGTESQLRSIVRLDVNAATTAFQDEAFCGVLFCVELPGNPEQFLRDAAAFANDRLYGTLGANLIVSPRTERSMPREVADAIAELRYGCVAVNAWAGVGYFLTETPWGDYRAQGEGLGVVHNSYLLANTRKSIVRAPFRPLTKPPWFVTNKKQARLGRLLCDFEAARSPRGALRVISAAI